LIRRGEKNRVKCNYADSEQALNYGVVNQVAETVCPAGQMIVGFKARSGAQINNLEFVCGGNFNDILFKVHLNTNDKNLKSLVAGFGGSSGAGSSMKCTQSYISAIYGKADTLVDRFGVKCGADFQDAGSYGGNGGFNVSPRTCIGGYSSVKVTFSKYVGSISAFCKATNAYQKIGLGIHEDASGIIADLQCNDNQILTGVDINSDVYVDRVTFFCGGSLAYVFED
jgi:hypothetical protein